MHIISLPPTDDTYISPGESLIRECWKWKDATLGDGRDYFLPKPRALKDFHSLFVGMEISIVSNEESAEIVIVVRPPSSSIGESFHVRSSKTRIGLHEYDTCVHNNCADGGGSSLNDNDGCVETSGIHRSSFIKKEQSFVIEECVALSNCARLDVTLVLKREQKQQRLNEDMTDSSCAARYAVAYILQQQVLSRRISSSSLLDRIGLTTLLDLPGAIRKNNNDGDYCDTNADEIRQLANRLSEMEGARSISTHLSLLASGLSPRPNRPDREVLFRPYSSRDAHILLQLKRTVEVVSVLNMTTTERGGGRGRIKTLLDSALTAGKATRNERVVPEIRRLKEYGSNGTPPSALARVVAEAARVKAVEVSVIECVARLAAMETDTTDQIVRLRRRVQEIVVKLSNAGGSIDIHLQKEANKLLHRPTMQLRKGILLSEDEIDEIARMVKEKLISLQIDP